MLHFKRLGRFFVICLVQLQWKPLFQDPNEKFVNSTAAIPLFSVVPETGLWEEMSGISKC